MTWHSAIIHFPVALLIIAAVVNLLLWVGLKDKFTIVFEFNLCVGLIGVGAAVLSGQLAEETVGSAATELIEQHENIAYWVLTVFFFLFAWYVARKRKMEVRERLLYTIVLVASAALLSYGAYLGGQVAHGKNDREDKKPSETKQKEYKIDSWKTNAEYDNKKREHKEKETEPGKEK